MKRIQCFLYLLVLIAVSQTKHLGKNADGIEIFKIDLNQEPSLRFQETTLYFKEDLNVIISLYEEVIADAIKYMFKFLDWISFSGSDEHYQELDGIAYVLDMSIHEVAMMNYLYELDAYCTSIVARLANGTVFLARNLDFYFPESSRKTLYIAHFYRGDNFLFESPMFAGIIGVYTGNKPNAFAVAINERTAKNSTLNFAQNIWMMFSSYQQIGLLARRALTECHEYHCAVSLLSSEALIAGGYFIVVGTGPNEGSIISRDRFSVVNITSLTDERWYLVQTNQDHFNGDCPIRCQNATDRMNALGQKNLSNSSIYDSVLHQWPNLNFLSIYTSIFTPSTKYSKTLLVYSTNDTDPGDII